MQSSVISTAKSSVKNNVSINVNTNDSKLIKSAGGNANSNANSNIIIPADFNFAPAAKAWVDALLRNLTALTEQQKLDNLKIQKLAHELAVMKRMRFGRSSEALNTAADLQRSLFDENISIDIAAIESEIEAIEALAGAAANTTSTSTSTPSKPRKSHGRQALPAHLPRVIKRFDLTGADLACDGCGQDMVAFTENVSETLDITPAQFFVNRNIRPQYACRCCTGVSDAGVADDVKAVKAVKVVKAAPVAPAIIDGSVAATGLISWVLISKYADHQPLYRLEGIAARQGVNLPRSNLSSWVGQYGNALKPLVGRLRSMLLGHTVMHADETPIKQLSPGSGKTKQATLWAYRSAEYEDVEDAEDAEDAEQGHQNQSHKIILFDYQESRAGTHVSAFLNAAGDEWSGHLMVDGYAGYKALFRDNTHVIELGCLAHARRKFYDLYHANQSSTAKAVLDRIGALYAIESEAKTYNVPARKTHRAAHAIPKLDELKTWLTQVRVNTANGGALAKAIDYMLKRWDAHSRYAETGHLPIDNNPVENAIRPIAIGKKNWLFVGNERSGQHAAVIQSLIGTAKLNQLDPAKWLQDVLEKLPTWPNSRIDELLPFADYQFST